MSHSLFNCDKIYNFSIVATRPFKSVIPGHVGGDLRNVCATLVSNHGDLPLKLDSVIVLFIDSITLVIVPSATPTDLAIKSPGTPNSQALFTFSAIGLNTLLTYTQTLILWIYTEHSINTITNLRGKLCLVKIKSKTIIGFGSGDELVTVV